MWKSWFTCVCWCKHTEHCGCYFLNVGELFFVDISPKHSRPICVKLLCHGNGWLAINKFENEFPLVDALPVLWRISPLLLQHWTGLWQNPSPLWAEQVHPIDQQSSLSTSQWNLSSHPWFVRGWDAFENAKQCVVFRVCTIVGILALCFSLRFLRDHGLGNSELLLGRMWPAFHHLNRSALESSFSSRIHPLTLPVQPRFKTCFCSKVLGMPESFFHWYECWKNILPLTLHSPESSGETDADTAAATAGEGAEGSELYQTEDGKHISTSLSLKKHYITLCQVVHRL